MSDIFKIGDRVILTGKHLIPYKDWPVWGSKYSCVGTIIDVRGGLSWVTWDNDTDRTRMIKSYSLSHFTGGEEKSLSPNLAFLKYKRSKHGKR